MKNFKRLFLKSLLIVIIFFFNDCNKKNSSENLEKIPSPDIKGEFELISELSDEFEGGKLDTSKWFPNNPTWLGRKPGYFYNKNVTVSNGKLHLTMKKEEPPEMPKNSGYHTYTSAAVRSKYTVKYGFFEIKAKAMNSRGSSAFWFYDQSPDLWTEIDVFEICGNCPERRNKYNMNVHVFRTPLEDKHWSNHGEWIAPYGFADDYHVFGLKWTPYVLSWYVDGKKVRTIENTHWHQPLTMNFDSETFPDWFGLPSDEDLPSTFSIEYVRSWGWKTASWKGEGKWK